MLNPAKHLFNLSAEDLQRLQQLRAERPAQTIARPPRTFGARVADAVAETVGSWRVIIAQSVVPGAWIAFNAMAYVSHWDPYPSS